MNQAGPDFNSPLQIAGVSIPGRVLLAPVDGTFDRACRAVYKRFGAALTCSEMVNAHTVVHSFRKAEALLAPAPEEIPYAVQLSDHDPVLLGEASAIVAVRIRGVSIIDFNMGCPSRTVVSSGNGVALMRDPDLAARCVEAMVKASGLPVSVKMRTGFEHADRNAPLAARLCVEAGASLITVHGRSFRQMFSGEPDLETIAATVAAVRVPVVGNGGVDGPETARRMMEQTGCAAVMVAQAAFGNPWVLKSILDGKEYAPPVGERFDVMKEHFLRAVSEKGEPKGVLEMRKHLSWYLHGLHGASVVRQRIMAINSAAEVISCLDEYRRDLVNMTGGQ